MDPITMLGLAAVGMLLAALKAAVIAFGAVLGAGLAIKLLMK